MTRAAIRPALPGNNNTVIICLIEAKADSDFLTKNGRRRYQERAGLMLVCSCVQTQHLSTLCVQLIQLVDI